MFPSCLGYIFYGAKGVKKQALNSRPTIIWLCGGAGMSSQNSNFNGIGPFNIKEVNKNVFQKVKNENAWTNAYNVIFIDQPIGVGLSFAKIQNDIPATLEQLSNHFYQALVELYDNENGCFKQLGIDKKTNPLFIYGESFAGKYIPFIAEKIMQVENQFNLIGIGLLDANISPYYVMIGQNEKLLELELITQEQYDTNVKVIESFKSSLYSADSLTLRNVSYQYLNFTFKNVPATQIYNYKTCNKHFSSFDIDSYMNQQQTLDMFQLSLKEDFVLFDDESYNIVNWNIVQDSVPKIEFLLSKNIFVHIMNGDLDLLVTNKSQEYWIDNFNWIHKDQFKTLQSQLVTNHKGQKLGTSKHHDNFIYDLVHESGHFIPHDQPEAAFLLVQNAINKATQRLGVLNK